MITNGRFSPFREAALRAVRICWISQAGSVCCQLREVCQILDLTRSHVENFSYKQGSTQSCIRAPQLFHSYSSQYSETGGDISHLSTPYLSNHAPKILQLLKWQPEVWQKTHPIVPKIAAGGTSGLDNESHPIGWLGVELNFSKLCCKHCCQGICTHTIPSWTSSGPELNPNDAASKRQNQKTKKDGVLLCAT